MPGNPLVRFDEGRVGRASVFPSLLLDRETAPPKKDESSLRSYTIRFTARAFPQVSSINMTTAAATPSVPEDAYKPLSTGASYEPLVPASAALPELTVRSVGWGLFLCVRIEPEAADVSAYKAGYARWRKLYPALRGLRN